MKFARVMRRFFPPEFRFFTLGSGTTALAAALLLACGHADGASDAATAHAGDSRAALDGAVSSGVASATAGASVADAAPGTSGSRIHASDVDWEIAAEKILWAWEQDLQLLPIGEIAAMIGATFVGTPYVPHTLEIEGPERLVVNLRELDCVSFVEQVLVLSRLVLTLPEEALEDRDVLRSRFADELMRLRYRDGVLDGYPSRLHYFSEWISDGERKGLMRAVTAELGGIRLVGEIDFMSTHPEAYRQLADPEVLAEIRAMEERLNLDVRHYIPQERIDEAADSIRNGDIIAATSTVDGLDIAHTGFALWREGKLHLLHAPLVGTVVEISERPLADRIGLIRGQDGIMVARPLAPRPRGLERGGSE